MASACDRLAGPGARRTGRSARSRGWSTRTAVPGATANVTPRPRRRSSSSPSMSRWRSAHGSSSANPALIDSSRRSVIGGESDVGGVSRDRFVEAGQDALVAQRQDGGGGEALRHRGDAERRASSSAPDRRPARRPLPSRASRPSSITPTPAPGWRACRGRARRGPAARRATSSSAAGPVTSAA